MAGNELKVVQFILDNKGLLKLKHIGLVDRIQNPGASGQLVDIQTVSKLVTEDAGKKADVYLNGKGVSIKQSGSSFLFNRLQRATMLQVFEGLGLSDPNKALEKIDKLINQFHQNKLDTRDRHWSEAFERSDFSRLLKYLMMVGSPNLGKSAHPAEYILTAPKSRITSSEILVDTFDEYFEKYANKIFISLRRQWIGQKSNSEHKRALGLATKKDNSPWVFKDIVGSPRAWRSPSEFPASERRTVYMIFITVKP